MLPVLTRIENKSTEENRNTLNNNYRKCWNYKIAGFIFHCECYCHLSQTYLILPINNPMWSPGHSSGWHQWQRSVILSFLYLSPSYPSSPLPQTFSCCPSNHSHAHIAFGENTHLEIARVSIGYVKIKPTDSKRFLRLRKEQRFTNAPLHSRLVLRNCINLRLNILLLRIEFPPFFHWSTLN